MAVGADGPGLVQRALWVHLPRLTLLLQTRTLGPLVLSPALPNAFHFLSECWAIVGVGCDKGDETPNCSINIGSC